MSAPRATQNTGPLTALVAAIASAAAAAGCDGPQSSLAPAGSAAADIALLWWWMAGSALVVWAAVTALTAYAVWVRPHRHSASVARNLILGGGVVFPTVVLLIVLVFGLSLLPRLLEPAPPTALRVYVTGEQWWWRVEYVTSRNIGLMAAGDQGEAQVPSPEQGARSRQPGVVLANELHLPLGEPVELVLDSADVIHSLWIPSLAGKVDMIPGRTTRLLLQPQRPGVYRGACAEYCGTSHAHMAFIVVVEAREDFARWLDAQARPAAPLPAGTHAARGASLFQSYGCGACHAIRGTPAAGVIGPDLTHVGSRASLAAGRLANDEASFARWLNDTHDLKPGVRMPAFSMLPSDERAALAAFLEALQ